MVSVENISKGEKSVIRLKNIRKRFGEKDVLNNVTLDIKKGEIFGLIGKNGAGKTTLLSIIAGLIDATSGQCYIDGKLVEKQIERGKIGYLSDVPAFFDFMRVGEFIDFLSQGKQDKIKKKELLDLAQLNEKTMIKTMSRGMRQRLGLVAALVGEPEVILLDEPSSALDPEGRLELINILVQLKKQGKTILLSTHILSEMEKICDRVGFLHNGTIIKSLYTKKDKEKNVRLVFEKPLLEEEIVNENIALIQDGEKSIIVSEEFYDVEKQKNILKVILDMNNIIVNVEVIGIDLEKEFREICI